MKKREDSDPSYFRFPLVLNITLVNRQLFAENHKKIAADYNNGEFNLQKEGSEKCKHALVVAF